MTDRQAKRIAIDCAYHMEFVGSLVKAAQDIIADGAEVYLVRKSDNWHIGPLTCIRTSGLSDKAVETGRIDFWGKPVYEMFYFPEYRLTLGDHDRPASQKNRHKARP